MADTEWHSPGDCDAGITERHPQPYCRRPRRPPAPAGKLLTVLADRDGAITLIATAIAEQVHRDHCGCKYRAQPNRETRRIARNVLDSLLRAGRG